MAFVWVIGFLYCLQVWCLTKVIWIKHQNINLFVLLWFYIWFKITYKVFYQFCSIYSSTVLWNNVVENSKIPVTPPTSFNMRTYFGYLCDVCIRYFLQSFHNIIDKTPHFMSMPRQLPIFVLFLVKIIQQSDIFATLFQMDFSMVTPARALHANLLATILNVIT